ncbi:MAG: class I SAM-dependent methyltransferase [Desulfamplus sp.]|nr:class I SAM-dependent methyltransferase [Desulfamplus sp.]
MSTQQLSVFDRSGMAALSDLQTKEWKESFTLLEQEQSAFLSKESTFRSPEYKWPSDSLHNWSRVWEYPYVYHHLNISRNKFGQMPHIVDLGSGVTFFPFSVAKLGYHLTCADIDPICEKDLSKAIRCVDHEPGKIDFRLIHENRLPFSDGEADGVYCISVLEHIPEFENTISEIARILKPDGFFLLTVDLDLRGDLELGIEAHKRLNITLNKHFDYLMPQTIIHPKNILHSYSGPCAIPQSSGFNFAWTFFKQRIAKPLLGRKPGVLAPYHLTIQSFVMKKGLPAIEPV